MGVRKGLWNALLLKVQSWMLCEAGHCHACQVPRPGMRCLCVWSETDKACISCVLWNSYPDAGLLTVQPRAAPRPTMHHISTHAVHHTNLAAAHTMDIGISTRRQTERHLLSACSACPHLTHLDMCTQSTTAAAGLKNVLAG